MSLERIREEFKDLAHDPISNIGLTVGLENDDNYKDWRVHMTGPKDSVYRGGIFALNVHFPDNYPNEPPEVCFITPIYHLNVNQKAQKNEEDEFDKLGHVSISTLNWWNPIYKMKEVLCNIYSLFYYCNPDSAYGIERAKEYYEEHGANYWEKAKIFTKKYANPKKLSSNFDRSQDWDFTI